ncbi:hypothetical protein [Desulfogranum mediterraneum]|uniref:hypothetical protein n=1 Tax=Desulfogranum mediterraneum TaxID=160661 RepID=UPI001294828A|nr:hypothetical protein [Desulfogranum mediterraneum]
MKIWHKMILVVVSVITFLIVAVASQSFGNSVSWREEVLLHDGRKVLVERTADRGGRHEIGQRPPIKKQSLSFTLPSSKQSVSWKVEGAKDIGYADLSPIMLDIIGHTPFLVNRTVGCLAYNKWGRPNPPYMIFRYTNKTWQQIELEDLPLALKVPNMIISSPDLEAQRSGMNPVSAEKIHELNKSLTQPEFQSVLREPLPQERIDWCVEKIRTKGGWTSIYIFKSQPTYERCINACNFKEVLPGHCPCDRLFSKHK